MGIKKSGYESDHSPSSTATVRNKWSYPFVYPLIFMAYTKIILPYFKALYIETVKFIKKKKKKKTTQCSLCSMI
jgi:hypothetical protein